MAAASFSRTFGARSAHARVWEDERARAFSPFAALATAWRSATGMLVQRSLAASRCSRRASLPC